MKNILIIIAVLHSAVLFAQNNSDPYVSYGYDAAGNRVSRIIIIPNQNSRVNHTGVTTNDTTLISDNTTIPPINSAMGSDNLNSEKNAITKDLNYFEVFDQHSIQIFPNPTKGFLTVKMDYLKEREQCTIQLFDINGKQIFSDLHFNGKSELDFHTSPPGTYSMKMILNGKKLVWTIIKQ